jgi:HK97 family phage major capsid protein
MAKHAAGSGKPPSVEGATHQSVVTQTAPAGRAFRVFTAPGIEGPPMTATELRQKRANLLSQCRDLDTQVTARDGRYTAEENERYEKLFNEAADCKAQAEQIEHGEQRKKQLDDALADLERSTGRITQATRPGSGPSYGHDGGNSLKPYSFAFRRPDQSRKKGRAKHTITLRPDDATRTAWLRHQPEYSAALDYYLLTGQRAPILQVNTNDGQLGFNRLSAALQTDLSTAGGYMVLPEQFVTELLMDVDNIRWMRQLCRTFTTSAQTLGVVKRTSRMTSFNWGSELSTPAADPNTNSPAYQSSVGNYATGSMQGLAYGKRTLTPHYMTGEILASRDLLRSALLPVQTYIRYEIGRDSGELEENAFLTGNGTQQPLGAFTASADGIDTSRDVSTGNTTTTIGADNLRAMKYTLKAQYRAHPSLRFLWSRQAISQISRLKDGIGNYLWRDGLSQDDPDRLLGIAVVENEFAPNTFTTGQYVGLLGAFYFYWICDSLEMDLMTLVEKYAESNQIAYVARRKVDGMPQIAEAFVRSKLA